MNLREKLNKNKFKKSLKDGYNNLPKGMSYDTTNKYKEVMQSSLSKYKFDDKIIHIQHFLNDIINNLCKPKNCEYDKILKEEIIKFILNEKSQDILDNFYNEIYDFYSSSLDSLFKIDYLKILNKAQTNYKKEHLIEIMNDIRNRHIEQAKILINTISDTEDNYVIHTLTNLNLSNFFNNENYLEFINMIKNAKNTYQLDLIGTYCDMYGMKSCAARNKVKKFEEYILNILRNLDEIKETEKIRYLQSIVTNYYNNLNFFDTNDDISQNNEIIIKITDKMLKEENNTKSRIYTNLACNKNFLYANDKIENEVLNKIDLSNNDKNLNFIKDLAIQKDFIFMDNYNLQKYCLDKIELINNEKSFEYIIRFIKAFNNIILNNIIVEEKFKTSIDIITDAFNQNKGNSLVFKIENSSIDN